MTGIITIALKSHLYGRYAYNLMQSVKAIAPDMPFLLICDEAAMTDLTQDQKQQFDSIASCPDKYWKVDGKPLPLVAKMHLYQLSPFSKTLFLDADTLLSTNTDLKGFLAELDGKELTMANRGLQRKGGISEWVNDEHLQETYAPETWYDLSSEVIYFEKSDKVKQFFKSARKFYDEGKLLTREFAGDKPDEPFFGLAMNQTGLFPHREPWKPLWWGPQEGGHLHRGLLPSNFIGMSAGGKYLPDSQLRLYKIMCGAVEFQTKSRLFTYLHKRNYLPERKTM
jgi:hypothetical protein